MSGKLLSLFAHPEFVRRSQARAERELAKLVAPRAPAHPDDEPPDFDVIEALLAEISTER